MTTTITIVGLKRLIPTGAFFDCEYLGNNRGVAKDLKGTREVVSSNSSEITLRIHGGKLDKQKSTLNLKGVSARVDGEEIILMKNEQDFYRITDIRKELEP